MNMSEAEVEGEVKQEGVKKGTEDLREDNGDDDNGDENNNGDDNDDDNGDDDDNDDDNGDDNGDDNDDDDDDDWEEDKPVEVPLHLQRSGRQYLKTLRGRLNDREIKKLVKKLTVEGIRKGVIQTIISSANKFLCFKDLYLDQYPKYEGLNQKAFYAFHLLILNFSRSFTNMSRDCKGKT
jgi:hypothetical protein